MSEITRQAAGPGGPASLRATRYNELATGTMAVRDACRELILAGEKPSIAKVSGASGLHISSINRDPYWGILAAGRAHFDLVKQGMLYEEAVATIGDSLDRPVAVQDTSTDPIVAALLRKIDKLEAEVFRRDNQLYHSLDLLRQLRATLRWHRERLADLTMQIEGLTEEPIPRRSPRVWQEDLESEALGDIFQDDEDDPDAGTDEEG